MTVLEIVVVFLGVVAVCRGTLTLWMTLYAWDDPENLRLSRGPDVLASPRLSFTVLVPARSEEAVIAETILRLWHARYPRELLEIVVICQGDDSATIAAASAQIAALEGDGVRLEIYDDPPFNKPHALQVGYHHSSANEVIAVFDAEDDVHRDIFLVANTVMSETELGVVQGGVQLMNWGDHWFAPFSCLEYFFHYNSRLPFNARVGMVPLGGNTVFLRRELVDRVGGWDITCLTEDADIGVRISALGEPIGVIADHRWVTREETPHSVDAFVRQRTRWHHGFLQILVRGEWTRIPRLRCRALAFVTLSAPIFDTVMLAYACLMPLSLLLLRLPDLVAVLTFLPLYAVGVQLVANIVGLVLFARAFEQRIPLRTGLLLPLTFLPYQWMIGFSAARALTRCALGQRNWEKTEHRGAHRLPGAQRESIATVAPAEITP